eukprot:365480-Chlamydomonas_euryale.AAC.13
MRAEEPQYPLLPRTCPSIHSSHAHAPVSTPPTHVGVNPKLLSPHAGGVESAVVRPHRSSRGRPSLRGRWTGDETWELFFGPNARWSHQQQ